MKFARFVVLPTLLLTLLACQQVRQQAPIQDVQSLLHDDAFMPVRQPIETPAEIFALPAPLIEAARAEVLVFDAPHERSMALLKFIFRDQQNPLEYVNNATLTAWQTYEKREANCLSLTILSYSLAKALGFKAQFQDLKIPEYWVTRSGSSLLNGHVNLKVTPPFHKASNRTFLSAESTYTIDFEMEGRRQFLPVRKLSEGAIVALFYNNKAADAMLTQQQDLAYRYLQEAVRHAPEVSTSWSNLAVLYRQKQMFAQAERAYLQSLALEPEHVNTMANLALLYGLMGRPAEAAVLERKVEYARQQNPYYFVMLGNEALQRADGRAAELAFHRSLKLLPDLSEALSGLAQVAILQHDYAAAAGYLVRARRQIGPGPQRRWFDHKIEMLNAVATAR